MKRGYALYMDEIAEGLWLGSYEASLYKHDLNEFGIQNIVSLLDPTSQEQVVKRELSTCQHKRIWIFDDEDQDLLSHLMPACCHIQTIHDQNQLPVLIHCRAGISRSPSLTAAYLLFRKFQTTKTLELLNEPSTNLVKMVIGQINDKRTVWPNDAFLKQLEIWTDRQKIICWIKFYIQNSNFDRILYDFIFD